MIRVINLSYYDISLPLILFIVFSVYVSVDENNVLTSKKVFTTLSLLSFVRLISLKFLVTSVIQISEGRVALNRISVSITFKVFLVHLSLFSIFYYGINFLLSLPPSSLFLSLSLSLSPSLSLSLSPSLPLSLSLSPSLSLSLSPSLPLSLSLLEFSIN